MLPTRSQRPSPKNERQDESFSRTSPLEEKSAERDEVNRGYAAFHAPRFAFLLCLLREEIRDVHGARVLDVGMSTLTPLIAQRLRCPVDSLGLEPDGNLSHGRHYRFDLNDVQEKEHWRTDLGPYDVIVFAEVIEHLYTAPELVLSYLRSLLVPRGVLVVQTPNAAALRKRVKLLMGRQPYERIRMDRSNPGHFREYTAAELQSIMNDSSFTVEKICAKYYFDARFARHETGRERPARLIGSLKNILFPLLPGSLQEGITLLARKHG